MPQRAAIAVGVDKALTSLERQFSPLDFEARKGTPTHQKILDVIDKISDPEVRRIILKGFNRDRLASYYVRVTVASSQDIDTHTIKIDKNNKVVRVHAYRGDGVVERRVMPGIPSRDRAKQAETANIIKKSDEAMRLICRGHVFTDFNVRAGTKKHADVMKLIQQHVKDLPKAAQLRVHQIFETTRFQKQFGRAARGAKLAIKKPSSGRKQIIKFRVFDPGVRDYNND